MHKHAFTQLRLRDASFYDLTSLLYVVYTEIVKSEPLLRLQVSSHIYTFV